MRSLEGDHEMFRIEQRFLEMNKQIGELTSMMRALTEKMTNSREKNEQNARNIETSLRFETGRFYARVF